MVTPPCPHHGVPACLGVSEPHSLPPDMHWALEDCPSKDGQDLRPSRPMRAMPQ